ncbi:hypothetical protein P3T76_010572 [Phytophthora citrophthora]|uniref:Uncharacterized protein n=1 Tax=Phytophthora citrophthora TaxID=4793 RepID=A0AAD9LH28_9STRA|nr:hypothetical protein P3T76_010572 [Phytophthora citrophthora]
MENPDSQTEIKPEHCANVPATMVDVPIPAAEGGIPQDQLPGERESMSSQEIKSDEQTHCHENGDLSVEDLAGNLAVVPEILISTTEEVRIEDLQVGNPNSATPEDKSSGRNDIS